MSAHSYISIINKDRSIDAAYCHWDGGPGHQGPVLTESYGSAEKVRKLLALGSLVILGRNFAPEDKVVYAVDYPQDTTIACCRDLGEEMEGPVHFDDRKSFFDHIRRGSISYVYLYNEDLAAWMFAKMPLLRDGRINLRRLKEKDMK